MQATAGCAARRMDGILGGQPARVQTLLVWSYQFFEVFLYGDIAQDTKPNPYKGL